MSNAAVVRVRILSATSLTDNLLGPSTARRVWHLAAPEENTLRPYIVYGRVSGAQPHHLLGSGGLDQFRVQVEGFCDRVADLETLEEIVRTSCDGYRGDVTVDGVALNVRLMNIIGTSTDVFYPDNARGLPIYRFSKELEIAVFQSIPTY